jgi:hypothetical protein
MQTYGKKYNVAMMQGGNEAMLECENVERSEIPPLRG